MGTIDRNGPLMALTRVSRSYGTGPGTVVALRDLDLTIETGEMLTIVGPSGSGKSTCLNLLGCLDTPTTGTVALDGILVSRLSAEERARIRRERIGFVFQGANLIAGMSALRNVELPLVYRGVARRERTQRALAALAAVGLSNRCRHRPAELSGGQQQRVAIARAIVSRPRLLIADEPTGALDTRTGLEIIALLRDLNRRDNVAVVIVTHDASIADSSPRLVVFRDGRLVCDEKRRRSHVA